MPRLLSGSSIRNLELQVRRLDQGWSRLVSYSGDIIPDALGRKVAFLTMFDITERKRAEQDLRDREKLLRFVTGSARVGLVVVGAGYHYLFANEAYAEILGLPADAIVGRRVPDVLPLGWAQIQPRLDRALAGERVEYELTIPPPAGLQGERYFTVVYEPRQGEQGEQGEDGATVVVVVVDITKRRLAEAASKQQQERLEGVVNSAMDGIITIDESQRVILMNSAAERMFGCQEEEVLGQAVERFLPERFRAGHGEHVREFGRTGVAARSMGQFGPISGLRSNGMEFPLEASISQVHVDGRKLYTVTCRDTSERAEAEATRKKLEAQLQQSQKMEAFGQLAAGVAHDFNNLLTVIGGYSDLLASMLSEDDQDLQEMINEIRNAGNRAATLTRQLLAFSRQQILEPRVLNLNAVVSDVEKMMRRLIGEDIQFATHLRPEISPVKVDPGQIEQVIMNLCVNARDAMPQGGKLTIETAEIELDESYAVGHPECQPGRYAMLAISDNGAGMSSDVRARIFEPFFTTKGVGKGTGLGLAVVHGIVKQSGGSIEVYSEINMGTTFKIYLPAVQDTAKSVQSRTETIKGGRETILLVEDEEGVRNVAALALDGYGYTVLTACGGQEALDRMTAFEGTIALLVTDVVMPEMSGRVLAEKVRESYPGVKVLFLSGYTDDAIVRHGVLDADLAFLQKPFTPHSLASKVREVLDRPQGSGLP